jgi:PadR family transcriptional regulator, regulatory protein PadR
MKRNRPLSTEAIGLMLALAEAPTRWRYGYDLIKETGLKSGTLYPILMRLADRGLLEAQWQEPEQPGRPARHAYRLTQAGLGHLAEIAAQIVGTPDRYGEKLA